MIPAGVFDAVLSPVAGDGAVPWWAFVVGAVAVGVLLVKELLR